MSSCNVLIVILDTLREDYASELDKLREFGFVKYDNAVAQSSWTLPSHVSMITGEIPAVHGVHEGIDLSWTDIMKMSKAYLCQSSILRKLKNLGYSTYGASANPFISPEFGFEFDDYHEFNYMGEVGRSHDLQWEMNWDSRSLLQHGVFLLKKGGVRLLMRMAFYRITGEVLGRLKRQQMEKGSKFIVKRTKLTQFREPFLYLVNLMESHQPYIWGEEHPAWDPTQSDTPHKDESFHHWKDSYPRHARRAISRAQEIVRSMIKYDPLIIVTSDHGQLLGEGNRYGHGYRLDDVLLRVPLYIRLPGGRGRRDEKGPLLALVEIPRIIEGVISGDRPQVGNDYALSESFGCEPNIAAQIGKEDQGRLEEVFARRVKIFSERGSFVINCHSGLVEDSSKDITEQEIKRAFSLIPPATSLQPTKEEKPWSIDDEQRILRRLRDFGYE